MRFNKKKLMEKSVPALMVICHTEGIDATGVECTRDDLSNLILLMALEVYPHSGPSPNAGPGSTAPHQDEGVSVRVQRLRDQAA